MCVHVSTYFHIYTSLDTQTIAHMCVWVPPGPKSSIEDFRVIAYSGPVAAEGSKSSIGHFRVIVKALQTRK